MDCIVSLQWLLREQETEPMFRNGFYYHNECHRNYYHHHSLIQEAIKIVDSIFIRNVPQYQS